MSKFDYLNGATLVPETITHMPAPPIRNVRLWGPVDTNLSWAELIITNVTQLGVLKHGREGRRSYIECEQSIMPLEPGDSITLRGIFNGAGVAYRCEIRAGLPHFPNVESYEYSFQLGVLA